MTKLHVKKFAEELTEVRRLAVDRHAPSRFTRDIYIDIGEEDDEVLAAVLAADGPAAAAAPDCIEPAAVSSLTEV